MALYRLQAVLPYFTGLPADVATNTIYVDAPNDGAAEDCAAAFALFYERTYVGGHGVLWYMSGVLSDAPDAFKIRGYRMADPLPREPIFEYSFTGTETRSTESLPLEVALCCSFKALPPNTPSRRGRIFIGPLSVRALDVDATGVPTAAFMNAVAAAAYALNQDLSDLTATWIINGAAGPVGVAHGWVDNAFDTQRRRGVEATTRVSW